MRDIENAAIPVLEPMIFAGNLVRLDGETQQIASSWAFLRTLVIQRAADRTGLPDRQYRDLESLKDRPPRYCFVWLGAFSNPNLNNAYFHSASLDYTSGVAAAFVRDTEPEAYVATFAIGHLVGRVFLYSPMLQRQGHLGRVDNPGFDNRLIPTWLPGVTVTWPSGGLSLDSYNVLAATLPTALVAN